DVTSLLLNSLIYSCPSSNRGSPIVFFIIFFFDDTATTEIYTLSLHDALPIWTRRSRWPSCARPTRAAWRSGRSDRKSTRLNSSHGYISYAVFCLKKKRQI